MAYFPVSNSNLSAFHIGLWIQKKYGLSKNTQCTFIKAGINDAYLVMDGEEKFIFRVYSYRWRTEVEIEEEIKLLHQLHQNQVSVSYPLADMENQFIQQLEAPEGVRFAVLFTYAKGEKQPIISKESHKKMGELMARLHQVTHQQELKRTTYTAQRMLVDSLAEVEHFLPADTEEMKFMQTCRTYLLKEWEKADISAIRTGVVHMDIWFDNISMTEEGEATIFDFDFCGNGWLCLDIAYYVLQIHNVEKYDASEYHPKVDAFIQGYESVTPISAEEKRLLPMLGISLYFFYLGIQCQRYENWSNSFLNENYLKRFINGLVKKYYQIHGLGEG